MSRAKACYILISLLILVAVVLGACATPTPVTIIQTVEVEKQVTKIVEGTPVEIKR